MLRSALQGWGDPTGSSVELPMPRVLVPLLQKGLLELATLPPHALAVLQAVVPEGSEQRVRASGFPCACRERIPKQVFSKRCFKGFH